MRLFSDGVGMCLHMWKCFNVSTGVRLCFEHALLCGCISDVAMMAFVLEGDWVLQCISACAAHAW